MKACIDEFQPNTSQANYFERFWGSAKGFCEMRAAAREEKRETARLARANELSVGLTTQNTIGWFVKRWQQTVNNRNHWQVDDGWSNAGKFVTFPEKKKRNTRYGAKRAKQTRKSIACENIRFSPLFAAGDEERGETDVFCRLENRPKKTVSILRADSQFV